ncbi:MAG: hypothetical protein AAB131_11760 [Actinomycetota bacterium]
MGQQEDHEASGESLGNVIGELLVLEVRVACTEGDHCAAVLDQASINCVRACRLPPSMRLSESVAGVCTREKSIRG